MLRMFTFRNFGFTPLIGVCSIKEYGKYRTTVDALLELAEHLKSELLELHFSIVYHDILIFNAFLLIALFYVGILFQHRKLILTLKIPPQRKTQSFQ